MKKCERGQIDISFGMIFSIILVIVFLAFAFYAIKLFLNTQNEAKSAKLINDIQSDMNRIWQSTISSEKKTYNVPSGTSHICIIDFSQASSGENRALYEEIKNSGIDYINSNFVIFPLRQDFGSTELEHIDIDQTTEENNPLCIESANGKVSIAFKKDYGENLVTIKTG